MQKQLQSITLNNYRSYANETINFEGLNGIVGLNNHGKSSVYRALDMLLTNGNFRDKDIRRGTKSGWARLDFTDGSWLRRGAGLKEIPLTLCDGINEPIEYGKYSDMDAAVQQFTGFLDIKLDKTGPSESIQMVSVNAPQGFLIEKASPETIMRRINRLAGGTGVDLAKVELEKLLKEQNKEYVIAEELAKNAKATVDKYAGVDVVGYREKIAKITEKVKDVTERETNIRKLADLAPKLAKASDLDKAKKSFVKVTKLFETIDKELLVLSKMEEFYDLLNSASEVKDTAFLSLKPLYEEDDALTEEIKKLDADLIEAKVTEQRAKEDAVAMQRSIDDAKITLAPTESKVVETSVEPGTKKLYIEFESTTMDLGMRVTSGLPSRQLALAPGTRVKLTVEEL